MKDLLIAMGMELTGGIPVYAIKHWLGIRVDPKAETPLVIFLGMILYLLISPRYIIVFAGDRCCFRFAPLAKTEIAISGCSVRNLLGPWNTFIVRTVRHHLNFGIGHLGTARSYRLSWRVSSWFGHNPGAAGNDFMVPRWMCRGVEVTCCQM